MIFILQNTNEKAAEPRENGRYENSVPDTDSPEENEQGPTERFYIVRIFLFAVLLTALCFFLSWLLHSCRGYTGETDSGGEFPVYPLTVILDPGHGGFDGGAVSVTGALEKDLNLSMALELRELLIMQGIRVVMTRTEDEMLTSDQIPKTSRKMGDLQGRLDVMRKHPDAVFVSIHMNKFPQEKVSGAQVYYSGNDKKSKQLASSLQQLLKEALQPDNERAVKEAGSNIFLLDRAPCPAILVECGFLSNPAEAKKLENPEYRKQFCCILSAAILTQLENNRV